MPYSRTTYDDVAHDAADDRRRFDEPPPSIADRHWPRPADVAAQLAEDWRHDLRTGQLEDDRGWWDDRTDDWWVA